MYDGCLGRFWSVDPLEYLYPSLSPYIGLADNPIITIDPDGRENIVVVGNHGTLNAPAGTFLEAGLNEAISFHKKRRVNGETTTLIVYAGTYTDAQIVSYTKKAEAAGINFVLAKTESDVKNYINKGEGYIRKKKGGNRQNDLITDFSYIGHAGPKGLYVGYEADESVITGDELSKDAFHATAYAHLNGCGTGTETILNADGTRTPNSDVLFQKFRTFAETVKAYRTPITWGGQPLGKYKPGGKEYARPADRDALETAKLRKTVSTEKRTRWSSGNKETGNQKNKKVNGIISISQGKNQIAFFLIL